MASSDENGDDKECPLCMEALELDDLNFYPCNCQYQICRFCWHRIRTDENGLCPACRQQYPEDPVNFKPLSAEDLLKIRNEKKLKVQKEKQKVSECRKHLANLRVLQKNLVYVVGLSPRLADPETLKKADYFGRFGKIHKVVVVTPNNNNCTSQTPINNGTAYVTYYRCEDALKAITNVNNVQVDGRALKACLGTTKYCSAFLRNQTCHKQECMYLHEVADDEASFTKEDMHLSKHADYERKLLERYCLVPSCAVEAFRVGSSESTDSQTAGKENNNEDEWHKARLATRHRTYNNTNAPKKSRSVERAEPELSAAAQTAQLSHSQSLVSDGAHYLTTSSSSNCQGSEPNLGVKSASRSDSAGGVASSGSPANEEHNWPTRYFNAETRSLFTQEDVPFGMQLSPERGGGGDACTSTVAEHTEPSLASLLAAHITANYNGSTNNQRGNLTSEDPAVVAGAPLTAVAAPTDWQAAFGLKPDTSTLTATHQHHTDDDLGFDPFNESAKGLADLLEQEKVEHQKQQQQLIAKQRLKITQPQHLVQQNRQPWPAKNGGSLPSDSAQFLRTNATSPIPHNFNTPPPGFIPLPDTQQNGPKLGGMNGYPAMNGLRMPPTQALYSALSNRDPSPTHSCVPRSMSPAPPAHSDAFSLKELQALLPNVNVRFAPGTQMPPNGSQHKTSPSPNWLSCPPPPLGHPPPPFNQPPPPLSVSTTMAMNNHVPAMRPSPPGPPDALFSMPPPPFGAPPRPPMGYPPGTGWTPPPPPGFSPRQQSI